MTSRHFRLPRDTHSHRLPSSYQPCGIGARLTPLDIGDESDLALSSIYLYIHIYVDSVVLILEVKLTLAPKDIHCYIV